MSKTSKLKKILPTIEEIENAFYFKALNSIEKDFKKAINENKNEFIINFLGEIYKSKLRHTTSKKTDYKKAFLDVELKYINEYNFIDEAAKDVYAALIKCFYQHKELISKTLKDIKEKHFGIDVEKEK